MEKCSFVLGAGFTTPAVGFKEISIQSGQDITIDGNGQAVVDAHGQDRMFSVINNSSLSITGVTMQNGKTPQNGMGGGAISVDSGGHLKAVKCVFKNNIAGAWSDGGAIIMSGGRLELTECTFKTNSVTGTGDGGAIKIYCGSVTMVSCTFEGNAAPVGRGGAVALNGLGPYKPVIRVFMTSCTFEGNTAAVDYKMMGGAVYVYNGDTSLTIISCSFKGGQGKHTDSVSHQDSDSIVTFACPPPAAGAPVSIGKEELEAGQLPPATEIVHCTR
jgi:hypothetical protein